MQKLSEKIMVMLYKSCSVLHKESKKLGMHFYDFFYDFLCILQESAKLQTLFKNQFSNRPLGSFSDSQVYPFFGDRPRKRSFPLQLGPWAPTNDPPAEFRARAEGGLQVSYAQFSCLVGADGPPECVAGGAGR
jgi:hypothetical protein